MTRLIFLLKKYVLAIFPIFIALFIFKVALFFFYFRYLPPKSSDGLDQKMQRLLIAQETGLLLGILCISHPQEGAAR